MSKTVLFVLMEQYADWEVAYLASAFHMLGQGTYAGKKQLADEAIYLERGLCQENGGWQDQIAASFGGMNRIDFRRDGYEVHPFGSCAASSGRKRNSRGCL